MVRGARQVGKTYTIREFGKKYFENIVEVNFDEIPQIKESFVSQDVNAIIFDLENFYETPIKPGRTLLFFDEIQACPKAIASLRYFYEKHPGIHVIAAGSLLDHILNEFPYSMPVGRVEFAYMNPMSFNEFLLATGNKKSFELIRNFIPGEEISPVIHRKITGLLRNYISVGGMPEAVDVYIKSSGMREVAKVHESILRSFEYDFAKYGSAVQQRIMSRLLRYLPKTPGQKFKYVNFDPVLRSSQIKDALKLLELSRIVHIVSSTNAVSVPLETGVNEKVFKTTFLDIGLVSHILNPGPVDLNKIILNNEGGLAEQFVAQEIIAGAVPFTNKKLHYWTREKKNSSSEIDYLVSGGSSVMPIEVKAGKTGSLKSLHVFMAEKKMKTAIRFNADQPSVTGVEGKVVFTGKPVTTKFQLISLPHYLAGETERIVAQNNKI